MKSVLGQHVAVTGSGVIGRADGARGQVPVAFITVLPERRAEMTEAALEAFCREQLAVYKIPEIRIVETLPMTATGKVKRKNSPSSTAEKSCGRPSGGQQGLQFLRSLHSLSPAGTKASEPGTFCTRLIKSLGPFISSGFFVSA